MTKIAKDEVKEMRKQRLTEMEQKLHDTWSSEENRLFYYHPSEDRIVLSHTLFWVMTQPQSLKGNIRKEMYFLLLRQYQEEMLDTYLMDTEDYPTMLHYCNIIYETLTMILTGTHNLRTEKDARKLAATAIVAAGFGGDMDDKLASELLDDMDFFYDKVKCRKIEQMLLKLEKMVVKEVRSLGNVR